MDRMRMWTQGCLASERMCVGTSVWQVDVREDRRDAYF